MSMNIKVKIMLVMASRTTPELIVRLPVIMEPAQQISFDDFETARVAAGERIAFSMGLRFLYVEEYE